MTRDTVSPRATSERERRAYEKRRSQLWEDAWDRRLSKKKREQAFNEYALMVPASTIQARLARLGARRRAENRRVGAMTVHQRSPREHPLATAKAYLARG